MKIEVAELVGTTREQEELLYPPRRPQEPAKDFLLRTLREHRETHVLWRDAMLHRPEMYPEGCMGSLICQEVCVERYDSMISALGEL